jgi:intracellular sulfur oxidation DsrE/DsrF family protein
MKTWMILLAAFAAAPAFAKPAAAPTPVATPARLPGLVFALSTGLEDGMKMTTAFRQARVALAEGAVDRSTVVISGRAAVIFLPGFTLPADLAAEMKSAKEAGVRVVVCEHSLGRFGIPTEHAATMAEVVPRAIVEIATLAAAGHEVLSF